MKLLSCLLALGLFGAGPAVARSVIERTSEKAFAVQPGGTIRIETQGGDVRVLPGAGDQVQVVARIKIKARTDAAADALLEKLTLEIEQSGNDVSAVAKYAKRSGGSLFGSWPPVQVGFDVSVPARFNTDLRTQQGSVRVGTVGGRAVLETVSGDIEVMSAYDVVDAKAADGDVNARFARIAGPSRLRTGLGNITTIINPEENFSIKARSRWGKIFSEMPVEAARGGTGRSRLVGEYNGGGPELEVEAPGGFVRIKGGEPLFEISD